MTDASTPPEGAQPQKPGPLKKLGMAAVLILIAVLGLSLRDSDEPSTVTSAIEDLGKPAVVDLNEVSEQDKKDREQVREAESSINFESGTRETIIAAQQNRIEQLQRDVDDIKRSVEQTRTDVQRALQESQNSINAQISDLVGVVTGSDAAAAARLRGGDAAAELNGQPLPPGTLPPLESSSGLPGDPAAPTGAMGPVRPASRDFPYQRFGYQAAGAPVGGEGGDQGFTQSVSAALGPSGGSSGSSSAPVSGVSPVDQALNDFGDNHVPRTEATPGAGTLNAQAGTTPGQTPTTGQVVDAVLQPQGPTRYTRTIPALSYIKVTTLHGVPCPILSGLQQAAGALLDQQRPPVVLAATGSFRSPEGKTYKMDRVHLLGRCEGRLGKRPTANLVVEKISYLDAGGETHYEAIKGYVIDKRDNELGIRGDFETRRSKDIAYASIAAGVDAAARLGAASQFTTQVGSSGNPTQILSNGQLPTAAGFGFFAQAANEVANFFREQAARNVDVVNIQSGVPLHLVITDPLAMPEVHSTKVIGGSGSDKPLL